MKATCSHSIDYKGYTVICDNGLYYLAINPTVKYLDFQGCKDKIDRLTKDEPVFVNRKQK